MAGQSTQKVVHTEAVSEGVSVYVDGNIGAFHSNTQARPRRRITRFHLTAGSPKFYKPPCSAGMSSFQGWRTQNDVLKRRCRPKYEICIQRQWDPFCRYLGCLTTMKTQCPHWLHADDADCRRLPTWSKPATGTVEPQHPTTGEPCMPGGCFRRGSPQGSSEACEALVSTNAMISTAI